MKIRRLFTFEEAQALLPQLEAVVARLMERKEAHNRFHDEVFLDDLIRETIHEKSAGPSSDQQERASQLDEAVGEFEKDLEQLRGLGCILRSLEAGWVDIPSSRDGQTVYLCWKKGDKTIRYYRALESAPSERLPL